MNEGGWVPISAKEYVRFYYPEFTPVFKIQSEETKKEEIDRKVEADVQATILLLQDYKLVTLQMLAEAWPSEYEKSLRVAQPVADTIPAYVALPALPSLADMTVVPAVINALHIGDTCEIEAMLWMPGKTDLVKTALRTQAPLLDTGIALLTKIIAQEVEEDRVLDLSGLVLSSKQLITLISAIGKVESLDLSHNPVITIDTIRTILTAMPLKRLVLLGCSSVLSSDINNLLHSEPELFYTMEALIHPFLLGRLKDVTDTSPYCNSFSYIGLHDDPPLIACSLPFFMPSTVIQALIDSLGPLDTDLDPYPFFASAFPVQSAFSSVRKPGKQWSERSTVVLPQLGLGAFRGEGWTFALSMQRRSYDQDEISIYAFIRFAPPLQKANKHEDVIDGVNQHEHESPAQSATPAWEIHDFSSFLNQMALEGRPCPPDELVAKLNDILTGLQTRMRMRLMVDEQVQGFRRGVLSRLFGLN